MTNHISIDRYLLLFIPWLFALLFNDHYILSYLIAWLGSFFIFYLTLTGKVRPLPQDLSFSNQLMRPIFLVQIIFTGYMCCTSIFYFLDVLGYVDFNKADDYFLINQDKLGLTAECQRYYCLAHASFVSGILFLRRDPIVPEYKYEQQGLLRLIFTIALITVSLSYLLTFFDGLLQFAHQLRSISFIAVTLALAFAIPKKNTSVIIACLMMYGFNFYQALISGFKEPIILSVLVLCVFLYPNYKRTITLALIPLLFILFVILPSYNRIFREHAWGGANVDTEKASALALNSVFSKEGLEDSNWSFLVFRLSEIDMFTKYIQSTPTHTDYYGFGLIEQSLLSIIPRALWPSKPFTETLVMERVYNAGVVSRSSNASAKPAFIVDAYLSGGALGIFICLFSYGALCQFIANKAEKLFGGYTLGTALIFTGLFQIFWRGQSFEFLFNSICWSYASMYLIFYTLRSINILKSNENLTN